MVLPSIVQPLLRAIRSSDLSHRDASGNLCTSHYVTNTNNSRSAEEWLNTRKICVCNLAACDNALREAERHNAIDTNNFKWRLY
eukprot:1935828-Amphidinium_carterae.1